MEQKLRLALGIISGRVKAKDLKYQDYNLLGYDSHKFSYHGEPEESFLLVQCENIIVDAILSLTNHKE